MKTRTLTCDEGHEWEAPSQRGRPPKWCPEHRELRPTPKDLMIPLKASIKEAGERRSQRAAEAQPEPIGGSPNPPEIDDLTERIRASKREPLLGMRITVKERDHLQHLLEEDNTSLSVQILAKWGV
jgi:hypothetical protein